MDQSSPTLIAESQQADKGQLNLLTKYMNATMRTSKTCLHQLCRFQHYRNTPRVTSAYFVGDRFYSSTFIRQRVYRLFKTAAGSFSNGNNDVVRFVCGYWFFDPRVKLWQVALALRNFWDCAIFWSEVRFELLIIAALGEWDVCSYIYWFIVFALFVNAEMIAVVPKVFSVDWYLIGRFCKIL